MKRYPKLTWLALITLACSAAANADIQGRIVGYGTYTVTDKYKTFKTPGSISGLGRGYLEPPTFTAVTDRIRAKKNGVRFGIVFELTNLPKTQHATVGIVLVVKYPPVHKPDGTTSTHFKNPSEWRFGLRIE